MSVKLNKDAFEHAKSLISKGKVVSDKKDQWSEDQPSTEKEDKFIKSHGFEEYAKWYLGINEGQNKNTKGCYEFPYGDFEKVHRCGLLAAETRAGQYKHTDIEKAVTQLLHLIDQK